MAETKLIPTFLSMVLTYGLFVFLTYFAVAFVIGDLNALSWRQGERFGLIITLLFIGPLYGMLAEWSGGRKMLKDFLIYASEEQPHD